MFDHSFSTIGVTPLRRPVSGAVEDVRGSRLFWLSKHIFDIVMSVLLLAIFLPAALVLLAINPFLNKGPLFFVQTRMGRGCRPFRAYKFRSMTHVSEIQRRHDDPIERNRITPLGRIIRKCRLDELPQILNVLKGEMSLIGPRPDYFDHAEIFLKTVPGYRERHVVRPGISGLAQVEVGYVEGSDATRAKVAADLCYITNAGWSMEARVIVKTLATILFFRGA